MISETNPDPEQSDVQANDEASDFLLPTLSLVRVAHPTIPGVFHCCFEYFEPWQWSSSVEHVETGHWIYSSKAKSSVRSLRHRKNDL